MRNALLGIFTVLLGCGAYYALLGMLIEWGGR